MKLFKQINISENISDRIVKPVKSEWKWPAIMIAVMIFFSALFYVDYTRSADVGNRKVIGHITYKYNRVLRRFADQVVWSTLENNSPLVNRDTIRSDDYAAAEVHLKNGTIIKVDEHSMFYLDVRKDRSRIDFRSGSIQVEQSKTANGDLVIQSGNKKIDLKNSDVKIESQGRNKLNMVVHRGNATVRMGKKKFNVSRDQKANLTGKDVNISKLAIKLISPGNQHITATDAGRIFVPFKWEFRTPVTRPTLEISRYRGFSKMVVRRTASNSSSNIKLSSGVYYWRVRGRDTKTGKKETSEVRKLIIASNAPVSLLSPDRKSKHYYIDKPPMVHFAWSASPLAAAYRLEISRSPGFKKITKSYRVFTNVYALNTSGPGKFYWRVKVKPTMSKIRSQASKIRMFRIVKKDAYDIPRPHHPRHNQQLALEWFRKTGVLFVWRDIPEIDKYQLQISRNPSFRRLVLNRNVSGNYSTMRSMPGTGTYYWRVRGISAAGKKSGFSSKVRFYVRRRIDIKNAHELGAGDPLDYLKPGDIRFVTPKTIYRD